MESANNVVNLLDINVFDMIRDIKKRCLTYGISLNVNKNDVVDLINNSVEVGIEEIEEHAKCQRAIIKKRDGSGVYVSVRNFSVLFFLEGITDMISSDFLPITAAIFLVQVLKQLGKKIGRREMLVYSIIYAETRKSVLTDENLVEKINYYMKLYGYDELKREGIYEIVNQLLAEKIIFLIDDGRYMVAEKIIFSSM